MNADTSLPFRMGVTLHGAGHGHHGHSHGGGGSHGSHGSHGSPSDGHSHEHSHNHSHSHSHELRSSGSHKGETDAILKKTKSKLKKDLNVRAAFIHVLGDLVQSVGVFFASLLIYFKVSFFVYL